MSLPRLVLTPGEPAGIGPDLAVRLAQQPAPDYQLVVVADPGVLRARARVLGLPLEVLEYAPAGHAPAGPGQLFVEAVPVGVSVTPGRLDPGNGRYVVDTLARAADGCLSGAFDALVTGPVQKSVINEAGIPFTGHTEYFCERAGVGRVVMMLAAEPLRVALLTTHVPLSEVPALVTRERVVGVVGILHAALRRDWHIDRPRILVAGLNPHAGEGGHLGREEIEQITPALDALRADGMDVVGPLPADTLFTPERLRDCDAVLAMYHDQGLPVLKHAGFGRAVNVTLGLPFVRTSVDHGTALDLAGRGRVEEGSLREALALAARLSCRLPAAAP